MRAQRQRMTNAMLDSEWRAVDERKEATEPPIEEAARSYFGWEREQVIGFLQSKARAWQGQRLGVDIDLADLLDVAEAAQQLISRLGPTMQQAIREGFETGKLRIDADGPAFDADDPDVQRVAQQIFEVLEEVPKTSRGRLQEIVLSAYSDGKDLATVIDEVRQLYDGTEEAEGMTRARAKTIARTTSTAAFERGQQSAFRRNDVQAREWLTTRDGRQRRGHGEANGQRKPMTEPFEVRADTDKPFEQLEHPGDPSASAENVVNCRCTVLPSFGDAQDADVSPIAGVVETDGPS